MEISRKSKTILFTMLLMASSCSFNGNSNSKSVASLGNSVDGDSLELVETKEDGVIEIVSSQMEQYEEVVSDNHGPREDSIMDAAIISTEHKNEVKEEINNIINSENKFEEYVVQQGDTLMILAFRLYRDVLMWKEIAKWNEEKLSSSTKIYPGDKLKIKVVDFNGDIWQPMGNPYLIMEGDSLMGVSQNVYNGTTKYWRDIWTNNALLIKDPNIIYAGFTLYYQPIEQIKQKRLELRRQLASKNIKE